VADFNERRENQGVGWCRHVEGSFDTCRLVTRGRLFHAMNMFWVEVGSGSYSEIELA
jgi:hypothetical protein